MRQGLMMKGAVRQRTRARLCQVALQEMSAVANANQNQSRWQVTQLQQVSAHHAPHLPAQLVQLPVITHTPLHPASRQASVLGHNMELQEPAA
jgi:hypothetical protein